MMPCSTNVLSRSARMLEEMPSSDFVSSSRKCRRLPKIMSRMINRLHLSPTTSRVRLIGQPDLWSSRIGHLEKNRLHFRTGGPRMQLVVKRYQSGRVIRGVLAHVAHALFPSAVVLQPKGARCPLRERD